MQAVQDAGCGSPVGVVLGVGVGLGVVPCALCPVLVSTHQLSRFLALGTGARTKRNSQKVAPLGVGCGGGPVVQPLGLPGAGRAGA